jgi:hypothetical protein
MANLPKKLKKKVFDTADNLSLVSIQQLSLIRIPAISALVNLFDSPLIPLVVYDLCVRGDTEIWAGQRKGILAGEWVYRTMIRQAAAQYWADRFFVKDSLNWVKLQRLSIR